MLNKKYKLKIILFSTAFVLFGLISSISVYNQINNNHNNNKGETQKKIDTDIQKELNKNNLSPEEKSKMNEREKLLKTYGENANKIINSVKLGEDNNREFPKEDTNKLYNNLIKLAQNANYDKVLDRVDKELETYKFKEEYNWKIGNVYSDANIMLSTLTAPIQGKGYMVKNLKDPNMLLIGTLMIPEESRRDVILEKTSLSPIFDGPVTILSSEILDTEDSVYAEISTKIEHFKDIYKINFKIENFLLYAYIIDSGEENPLFYKIVNDECNETPYKDINYWISLGNN
ncbi:hypothetical protein NBN67_18965 [Clostridioides difficile]|uniref:hypothetical protein n=1 Tax=Clostridioides difficile TaxID=1496 RepID=UPI00202EA990|nr:hypothetical protein [Clostridioides difficile]MCM0739618.1 hypothetical protein [Clostridioides difficile]HBF2930717.1 hypothetical protein [Clostridioides difficile]HBF2937887.1 hypothetical protein [Clostridioides difficile]HBZ0282897.1 hypothetical protein [Clostridioides difficile]